MRAGAFVPDLGVPVPLLFSEGTRMVGIMHGATSAPTSMASTMASAMALAMATTAHAQPGADACWILAVPLPQCLHFLSALCLGGWCRLLYLRLWRGSRSLSACLFRQQVRRQPEGDGGKEQGKKDLRVCVPLHKSTHRCCGDLYHGLPQSPSMTVGHLP